MTTPLTLVIANKNYSSWSMRAWVALHGCGIDFAERLLKFDSQDWQDNIGTLSPSGLVPVLWEGAPGRGFATWDTLAILERAHDLFPGCAIWPADGRARARARSLCAEMHGGFRALRSAMPMNLRGSYPGKGMNADVAKDIERIAWLWTQTKQEFGRSGPYLFGAFSGADAYYAPVATRFATYGVVLSAVAREVQQALLEAPAVRAWSAEGLKETEFVAADEPYATTPPR
ncbi:MAG TPA: glutathione S-transferase [Burkholderiales bacterium]|nr:glutathione S-transferase [Burkholderiales bacterium]